ncbi:hypothetical protein FACS1894179_11040 [Bacteroidia bacterium]|nr:hypothetical protein FACS1894179_11040 [Bacteroidia bacterium]
MQDTGVKRTTTCLRAITSAYVKYNYFHQEQKKKFKTNPFGIDNLLYDKESDIYICPAGKAMSFLQEKTTTSDNGCKRQQI